MTLKWPYLSRDKFTYPSCNFDRVKLSPPDWLENNFAVVDLHDYVEDVTFTREDWCGRMRACRGVGALLPPDLVEQYDKEHSELF